ncbi:MAG: outer membrane lipoprotein-sorting protein [Moraxellaceae bacterium]
MRMLLTLLLLLSAACLAQATPQERGTALAQAADTRLHGYGDASVRLQMTLLNSKGDSATRELRVQSLEVAEGERTLMVFETPRDVAGTGLLSWNRRSGEDEQWLYLPAVKRVKQIGGANKSGPFMGSEFAFEDIVTPFWQKFSYRHLREETLDGLACDVIERTPLDARSGYRRQLVWIDREQQLIRRIDYYDRRDTLLKTYTASDFHAHGGRHWRPAEMQMVNHQTGKQTRLRWSDWRFGVGLAPDAFTQGALQRVK